MSALLVPYDFPDHSAAALVTARDLAAKPGAGLHLVHVVPMLGSATEGSDGLAPTVREDLRAGAERMLLAAAASVDDGPAAVATRVCDGGDVVQQICRAAVEIDAEMIVMGARGRTGLAHALLGSVTELRRARS